MFKVSFFETSFNFRHEGVCRHGCGHSTVAATEARHNSERETPTGCLGTGRLFPETEMVLLISIYMLQYNRHVKPAFDYYIAPCMAFADIIVPRGGENEVAINLIVQVK